MKKGLLWSGSLLMAAVMFSACSNEEKEPVQISGEGDAVKTSFTFSVPRASVKRSTSADVQADGSFKGLTILGLYPFTNLTDDYVAESSTATGAVQLLGQKLGTSEGNATKTFTDVALPTGDIAFLFYGQEDVAAGKVALSQSTGAVYTPADITFSLNNILADATNDAAFKTLFEAIEGLNTVLDAQIDAASDPLKAELTALKTDWHKFTSASNANLGLAFTFLTDAVAALEEGDAKTALSEQVTKMTGALAADYPYGLPEGTFALKEGEVRLSGDEATGLDNIIATAKARYMKPAALTYYVNAYPVDYSSTNAAALQWDKTAGTINATGSGISADRTQISPATTKIALNKTINYGVGRLDVAPVFIATGGVMETANDPDGKMTPVSVNNNSFELTGVLVGNLPTTLDWELNPSGEFGATVFDTEVEKSAVSVFANAASATYDKCSYIILPATTGLKALSKNVTIALQFKNNGAQFYGKDGIIPAGGTFYIAGQLSQNGAAVVEKDAIEKDFYTTAKLRIVTLKNATNTVPDIVNPTLELSMYVDLEWQEGVIFDQELGN